ncbi:uncharacterized protein B0H18DRAFT_1025164 [Fomitopsis serialis]|uniref:uncharacterized protein n=1 Tax=Fomitopsis serialis TaxID=139415 RepID=UPI002008DD4B|nr:uncharacterized protein B0H18DRAFT_1025164 [Neoantrodia serialis]KAH9920120.1 hypothetical protein B0H18DRAFT_1025164 [Neoantrodia serialis]
MPITVEDFLDTADFAANSSTAYKTVIGPLVRMLWPYKLLRKGDKRLSSALDLLDEGRGYMDRKLHRKYHDRHDELFDLGQTLRSIGGIPSWSQYKDFQRYKADAKVLYQDTAISSRQARSLHIRKLMDNTNCATAAVGLESQRADNHHCTGLTTVEDADERDITEQLAEGSGRLGNQYPSSACIPLREFETSTRRYIDSIQDDSSILQHRPMWAGDEGSMPGPRRPRSACCNL